MGYEEDVVRDRIKSERAARNWTQQQLADRVNEHGYEWRWSTVAKLEAGERGVQLGEASALADVFGISLEMLSGRRARPVGDLHHARRALLETLGGFVVRSIYELVDVVDIKARELAAADPDHKCMDLLGDVLKFVAGLDGVRDTAARIEREYSE